MSFEPIGEIHAIQDVVFTLVFSSHFTETDIGGIMQEKTKWSEFLPKEERSQVSSIVFGQPPPGGLPEIVSPLTYSRMKTDGNVGWQLRISDNQISIICSTYTRWDDVWGSAKAILINVMNAVQKMKLSHLNLQTRDVFEWKGAPEDMSAEKLFQIDGDFFPNTAKNFGQFWHLHNGYFKKETFDEIASLKNVRILDRTHIDAVNQNSRSFAIIDHSLRSDLSAPVLVSTIVNMTEGDYLNVIFTKMHETNKSTVTGLLVEDMQKRIGINA